MALTHSVFFYVIAHLRVRAVLASMNIKYNTYFLMAPICHEPVVFLATWLLYGIEALQNIHGNIVNEEYQFLGSAIVTEGFVMLVSYLLCTLVFLCAQKWMRVVCYTALILLKTILLFLESNFGTSFTPQVFMLVAETNQGEATEFLKSYISTTQSMHVWGEVVGIMAMIVAGDWLWQRIKTKVNLQKVWLQTILFCILVIALPIGIYGSRVYFLMMRASTMNDMEIMVHHDFPNDALTRLFFSCISPFKSENELDKIIDATINFGECTTVCEDSDIKIVVVIGESYIKKHAHIYGYELETTPNLDVELQEGRLHVFSDVISPYNITSSSLKNVFSCNSVSDKELWYDYPLFPAIFKRAGYYVSFYDNQWSQGNQDLFDFSLNAILHHTTISKISYDFVNSQRFPYDGDMIEWAVSHQSTSKKSLVIYHLNGQHKAAVDRYPHEFAFEHFGAKDIKRTENWMDERKRQQIAEYDNATLYNDYVMGKLFDMYRNQCAVVVYFSDHGEEIYDFRDRMGRDHNANKSREIIEYQNGVPFFVWCSEQFMATHSRIVQQIKLSINRPFSIDCVSQTLLGLGNISTKFYHPQRDVLSPEFIPYHRIIYDHIDYDQ